MNEGRFKSYIDRFGINDWWDSLSDQERDAIAKTGDDVFESGQSAGAYLATVSTWLNNSRTRAVALKVAQKSFELLQSQDLNKLVQSQFTDQHFAYMHLIQVFYRSRKEVPGALDNAIKAAKRMIYISPVVMNDPSLRVPPDAPLPAHAGYERLAILADKQKRYDAVVTICQQALSQGWSGDWEDRIEGAQEMLRGSN